MGIAVQIGLGEEIGKVQIQIGGIEFFGDLTVHQIAYFLNN